MTPTVKAMISGGSHTPTAPLIEFVAAYEEDDNVWWRVACGHHLNLFEAALERIEELENRIASNDTHMEA